jgi:hypothetical protein
MASETVTVFTCDADGCPVRVTPPDGCLPDGWGFALTRGRGRVRHYCPEHAEEQAA